MRARVPCAGRALLLSALACAAPPASAGESEWLPWLSGRLEAGRYAPGETDFQWSTWIAGGVGLLRLGRVTLEGRADVEVTRAFDPDGLLNPGKAVPTLHRCAEYGAMRVHAGALPFPHLPRF